MTEQIQKLRDEIAGCITAAREQGYDGTEADYELTHADCEWIVAAFVQTFSRKPTATELREASSNPNHRCNDSYAE